MAQFKNMYKVELNNGIAPVVSLKQVYYADVEANRLGAIVTMNGQPFPLSGTCTGSAILADGSTVPMAGVIDGNQAYIDLDSSCYSVEGQIRIFVKITTGGVTTTLLAAVGTVQLTETDTVIDPGTIIPSVSALITAIEDAVESIPADYTALLGTIAPLYANLTFPVKAGQWCWYSGVLYEANQDISTSENWTAAHWKTTTVGGTVSELKSAISSMDKGLSNEARYALLACFEHVAWADEHGQDYYDALEEALFPAVESISAVYTQSGVVYSTDDLDSLKSDLVVTAHYADSTQAIIDNYTLSGELKHGTSTITVSYGGKTTTFTVTVIGNNLIFSGYSDLNTSQTAYSVAPFYFYYSTAYDYNYPVVITAIEFNAATTGTLVIGYKDISEITGDTNPGNMTTHESLIISSTGKQKIFLSSPLTLTSGQCLAISKSSDARFYYGPNGAEIGFTYVSYQNYTTNSTNSLGMNIYGEEAA